MFLLINRGRKDDKERERGGDKEDSIDVLNNFQKDNKNDLYSGTPFLM